MQFNTLNLHPKLLDARPIGLVWKRRNMSLAEEKQHFVLKYRGVYIEQADSLQKSKALVFVGGGARMSKLSQN